MVNSFQRVSLPKIALGEYRLVIAVLLLAFALRTVALTQVPPGLHNDEVVEFLMTERVTEGRWAIFFPEDTGHEVLYSYLTAPFFALFGGTIFAMRLPSVFFSMLAMCAVWALARRLFGPVVALSALIGFAITFWTVMTGRVVLHVVLEVPLAALGAYFFWRARAASGRRSLALWGLSGLWFGLAIQTYTAARVLPAIIAAFGLYLLMAHRAQWRRWWPGLAVTLAVTILVALPLLIYLVRHPTADQLTFFNVNRPLEELRRGNLAPVLHSSLRTLGMFAFVGDPLPYFDLPGRPVFEPVGAILALLGLLIALRRWRQPAYAFTVLWFFISLAPGMLSEPAPSYTRSIGAQVAVFLLPGIAIATLLRRHSHPLTYAALALLCAGNLAWTAHDYFVAWPADSSVRFWHQTGLKAVADHLQANPDQSPTAICLPDHLLHERDPWWKPARVHMRYLLHRPDLALRYYNCADAVVLIEGPARYAFPAISGEENAQQYPIRTEFLTDETIVQRIHLPDELGVILKAARRPVSAHELTTMIKTTDVAVEPEPGTTTTVTPPVAFQDAVDFLGYELSDIALAPGASFQLTTYWRVRAPLPPQLSLFTHVLDSTGEIVTQQDRLALTSASLRPGDLFAQTHPLTLPADRPSGTYPLTIGLYTPADGARLPIIEGDRSRGDRLWLRPIRATAQ